MYKHILIPSDGSELSDNAVRYGLALAASIGAAVTVLTVTSRLHSLDIAPAAVAEIPGAASFVSDYLHGEARRILEAAAAAAQRQGVACDTVEVAHDHPYAAIISKAEERGCDLIVMASHGRRGVSAVVLGSETVKVLTHSTIPVLVHRA